MLYNQVAWSDTLQLNSGPEQATLIELYTSQGCSSCPPAERWLGNLQQDPRLWKELIPVAFHVDYWDYLGWRDRFAQSSFSARQHRYRQENDLRVVYTPGFVVNGREWRRWFGLNNIPVSDKQTGELELQLDGKALRARYAVATPENDTLVLNVAILGVGLIADVRRGENAGRRLPQDFVVLKHLQLHGGNGRWITELPQVRIPDNARLAIAAWVNRADRLEPLQAVGGWLPVN